MTTKELADTLTDEEWAVLEALDDSGGAKSGDGGIDNVVAASLEKREILDYRGFSSYWQWQLNDTSRALLAHRARHRAKPATVYTMAWFNRSIPDTVVECAEALAKAQGERPQDDHTVLIENLADAKHRWAMGEYEGVPVRRFDQPSLDDAVQLLSAASAHVFRQQSAGKHAQDRADAQELYPKIEAFLKGSKTS